MLLQVVVAGAVGVGRGRSDPKRSRERRPTAAYELNSHIHIVTHPPRHAAARPQRQIRTSLRQRSWINIRTRRARAVRSRRARRRGGLFCLRVIAGLQIDPERSYVPGKQASRSAGAALIRQ